MSITLASAAAPVRWALGSRYSCMPTVYALSIFFPVPDLHEYRCVDSTLRHPKDRVPTAIRLSFVHLASVHPEMVESVPRLCLADAFFEFLNVSLLLFLFVCLAAMHC